MNKNQVVYHFAKVDIENIKVKFTNDLNHRAFLEIPFLNRKTENTLCIIGQNPSSAGKEFADRTILYLEKFVYEKLPKYSKIVVINLYSRIDTNKNNNEDLLREECTKYFDKIIDQHHDFLIVFGQLKNDRAFKFVDKARELRLKLIGKNIYKLDIGSDYAPHPRNKKIFYGNYSYSLVKYNFEDIE